MPNTFAARLVRWQKRHGRHHLPWQRTRDAYRIWLSEIMLQQTQVATVVEYYQRFVARFPNIRALAAASQDEVLQLWAGLGYYSRARNLHRTAQLVTEQYAGDFPRLMEQITALPGIGRSTAAAISVFAFGARQAILDGNVKRVLCRVFGIEGFPGARRVEQALWRRAEELLPARDVEPYTQGLMDLGATVCLRTKPSCAACPLRRQCVALKTQRAHELPAPRPKKAYPEKSTAMLILLCGGEVLLEKRPASGIWGGLWSLPEIGIDHDAAQWCHEQLGLDVEALRPWPQLRHGFTHFMLRITPQPLRVLRRALRAEQPGRLWLTLEDALGAAIPKPVKTLLLKLGADCKSSVDGELQLSLDPEKCLYRVM